MVHKSHIMLYYHPGFTLVFYQSEQVLCFFLLLTEHSLPFISEKALFVDYFVNIHPITGISKTFYQSLKERNAKPVLNIKSNCL